MFLLTNLYKKIPMYLQLQDPVSKIFQCHLKSNGLPSVATATATWFLIYHYKPTQNSHADQHFYQVKCIRKLQENTNLKLQTK
jgi:hypothetical protein